MEFINTIWTERRDAHGNMPTWDGAPLVATIKMVEPSYRYGDQYGGWMIAGVTLWTGGASPYMNQSAWEWCRPWPMLAIWANGRIGIVEGTSTHAFLARWAPADIAEGFESTHPVSQAVAVRPGRPVFSLFDGSLGNPIVMARFNDGGEIPPQYGSGLLTWQDSAYNVHVVPTFGTLRCERATGYGILHNDASWDTLIITDQARIIVPHNDRIAQLFSPAGDAAGARASSDDTYAI